MQRTTALLLALLSGIEVFIEAGSRHHPKKDNCLAQNLHNYPERAMAAKRASSTQRVQAAFGRSMLLCAWGTRIAAAADAWILSRAKFCREGCAIPLADLAAAEIRATICGNFFSSAQYLAQIERSHASSIVNGNGGDIRLVGFFTLLAC